MNSSAVLVVKKFDCACTGRLPEPIILKQEILVLNCGGDGENLKGSVLWSLK